MVDKHPNYVVGWNGSLEELSRSIGNMRYDKLSEFLLNLTDDIVKQSEKDLESDRKKLSTELNQCAQYLLEAKCKMDKAWEICKPYMDKIK